MKCFLCKFLIKGKVRKPVTGTVDEAGAKICSNCYNNLRRKQNKENSIENICKKLEKDIKLKTRRLEHETVDADSIYEVVWRKVLLKRAREISNGTLKVFMLDTTHKDLIREFETTLRTLKVLENFVEIGRIGDHGLLRERSKPHLKMFLFLMILQRWLVKCIMS